MSSRPVELGSEMSNVVPLRYVARAGLLPELTRQTYDSLYKALREVILNSVDAGATQVTVDIASVDTDRTLEITDDGAGMTLHELQESFMSLGGSQKFGKADKFGRIGIGSLALMHYAQSVEIETTRAGSAVLTKAVLTHPWALDQAERAQDLGDFRAGDAWEETGGAKHRDHYTRIRLRGVDEVLVAECADVSSYYKLLDRLRRILPLPWDEDTRLAAQLGATDSDLAGLICENTRSFHAQVVVRSRWADGEPLTKRVYGDGIAQDEDWNGKPHPIQRKVTIDDAAGPRVVEIAGYLLSQVRPSIEWAGLTARVQNVAVEEHTFFDLETDPGFRKYITGEVWLLGNIDRTSFNRESSDYRMVARVMQAEIDRFKSEYVQAPQRAKVAIKRRLDQQQGLLNILERLSTAVSETEDGSLGSRNGLPSSNNGRIRIQRSRDILNDLQRFGATVALRARNDKANQPYRLRVAGDGQRVLVEIADELVNPAVSLRGARYGIQLVEGRKSDPAVIIKNRPREIVFNLSHDVFGGELRSGPLESVTALEFAYLLGGSRSDES